MHLGIKVCSQAKHKIKQQQNTPITNVMKEKKLSKSTAAWDNYMKAQNMPIYTQLASTINL